MRALSIETVDICPWALREGLILRKLDSEADGTALVETSVRDAGSSELIGTQLTDREATNHDRTTSEAERDPPISVAELLARNGTLGAPAVTRRAVAVAAATTTRSPSPS